nr:putative zinc finger A20 and AN1 domain-containing stress-associated protein 8 [Tanacetum cinerariifolium]
MKEELDQSTTPPLCKTGCGFYVNKETGGFCSNNQEPMENQDLSNEVVKKRNRCHVCNKRVGLVPFSCRCGESFRALHRMPEKHACKFNFKAAGHVVIEKHNPLCVADKLEFRLRCVLTCCGLKVKRYGVKCDGDEKKELLVESRVLIPETTFVGVESRVLIPETTFVDVESRGRICLNFIFLIPRSGGIRRTKANLEKNVLTWSPKQSRVLADKAGNIMVVMVGIGELTFE